MKCMYKRLLNTLVKPLFCLLKGFVWWSLTSWFAPTSGYTTREEFQNACSFISSVRPTVQSNPSRKRNFSKPEEFENSSFEFSYGPKTF